MLPDQRKICVPHWEEKSSCGHQPGTSCLAYQPTLATPYFPSELQDQETKTRFSQKYSTLFVLWEIGIFLHAVRCCTSFLTLSRVGSAYSEHGKHTHTQTHGWVCVASEMFPAALSDTCLRRFKSIGCHVCTLSSAPSQVSLIRTWFEVVHVTVHRAPFVPLLHWDSQWWSIIGFFCSCIEVEPGQTPWGQRRWEGTAHNLDYHSGLFSFSVFPRWGLLAI